MTHLLTQKGQNVARLCLVTLWFGWLGAGCRSVEVTRSGFLTSYESLQPEAEERARESFRSSQANWSEYDALVLEPLSIRLQPSSLDKVSSSQAQLLREHYAEFLLSAVGAGWELLDSPRPGALVLRSALTEVDTINMPVNWITGILVLWPVDTGGATIEAEWVDAVSGKQVAAIVNADRATLWNAIAAMTRVGHACQALEETADWLGASLAQAATAKR